MKLRFAVLLMTAMLYAQQDPITQALAERRFDAALSSIDAALRTRPSEARLWMLRGAALYGLKRPQESLAAYRKAIALQPKLMPALQAAAQLEYAGKDPAASKTLARILALEPENEVAHAMSGVLAFEAGDCGAAAKHFEKAMRQVGQQKTSMQEYGYCLLRLNRAAEAAPVLERLLAADPADSRTRMNLVLALSADNRPAEAIQVLKPLAEESAPDADVMGFLGELYRANDQVQQGIAAYRRGIELYPKEERLYIGLAALCSYYNSAELGSEIVELGIRNLPRSSRLYAMRGVLNSQLGKSEESLADFEHASALSPGEQVGEAGIAQSLLQENRIDDLLKMLRERLRNKPDDAAAGFQLAQALFRKGAASGSPEFAEARTVLEKAVRIDPQLGAARALLGKIYFTVGKREAAIAELETALKLQPDNRTAMYQLMLAYRAADRPKDAQRLQERMKQVMEKEREDDLRRSQIRLTKMPEGSTR